MPPNDRLLSGAAVVAIEALFAVLLLLGLAIGHSIPVESALKVFTVVPPVKPPAQPVSAPRKATRHRAARAAPPNLKARPTEIVLPPPLVPVPQTPILAAPVAGDGAMVRAGAASLPGPGTGSGGRGSGLGSGGDGDGDGGGGTAPLRIKGRLRDADYPRELWEAGIGGTVSVRYHVEIDGRVTDCGITGSSGNAELDTLTCRLIEQRFRYRPSLDEQGRRVRSTIVENHSWIIDDSDLRPPRAGR